MQVTGAAELKSREVEAAATFDFKQYMQDRAELVNEALDRAVPLQYPEAVTEAMRCAPRKSTADFTTVLECCGLPTKECAACTVCCLEEQLIKSHFDDAACIS